MWLNRILLIVVLAVLSISIYIGYKQIISIKTVQKESSIENVRTNQFLMSTISWSTQRQKTILFMRDKILDEWARTGLKQDYDRAYQKAEMIMRECERYPSLKPFLLLAVQCRESSFCDSTTDSSGNKRRMTSSMGALGSWQFVQSTARLLCDALGISYSDKVYTDISVSTRMAAKYFDILWATYNNDTMSVADYNGGPYQAEYYMHNRAKLSEETKAFVSDVMRLYQRYGNEYLTYKVEKTIALVAGASR